MTERLANYIGGEWVESDAADVHEVKNPATGEVIGHTPLGALMVLVQLTAKLIRDLAILILGEEPAAWK